jgi:hypothetical protein
VAIGLASCVNGAMKPAPAFALAAYFGEPETGVGTAARSSSACEGPIDEVIKALQNISRATVAPRGMARFELPHSSRVGCCSDDVKDHRKEHKSQGPLTRMTTRVDCWSGSPSVYAG